MADLGIIFSGENMLSTDTSHYLQFYRKYAVPLFLGHPV